MNLAPRPTDLFGSPIRAHRSDRGKRHRRRPIPPAGMFPPRYEPELPPFDSLPYTETRTHSTEPWELEPWRMMGPFQPTNRQPTKKTCELPAPLPRILRLIVRSRIVYARHVRGERAVATLRRVGREWAWSPCAWMPDGFGPSRETFPTERDALGDVGRGLR